MAESIAEARAERDEAMAKVHSNADPIWLAAAWDAVCKCARLNKTFTVDEVWDYIPDTISTHDSRAMGPVIKRAQTEGVIEKTDAFLPSIRRHATPQRVWKSLVFLKGYSL